MANPEAEAVIQRVSSQTDLLITLSLGITGGLLLVLLQIALHNRDTSRSRVDLLLFRLVPICFCLEGLSIVTGTLAQASLTSVTPAIYKLDFSHITNWSEARFEGSGTLIGLAGVQFLTFLGGAILLFIFILLNARLARGGAR